MWRIRDGSSIVLKDIYYSSFLESYVYPSIVPRIDIVGIKLPPVFLQLSSWSIGFSHDSYHLFICHAYMQTFLEVRDSCFLHIWAPSSPRKTWCYHRQDYQCANSQENTAYHKKRQNQQNASLCHDSATSIGFSFVMAHII